ncbi:MAG: UbiD family decarboxylase [Planctomycetota bacterium]|nr:UbiD family decarboxylase [Planctomycetota bacterium]MEE2991363.1 UbiD family decarboxylase [Planctomycetota bacterium]
MGYHKLRQCVNDLQSAGQLVVIEEPVDANLEAAEIHRRVNRSGGPAILFNNVVGCSFPMVSNLFGTLERARFLFRDTLQNVKRLVELKSDPSAFWKRPGRFWKSPWHAMGMLPRRRRGGPVLSNQTTISRLPQLVSWPGDGGAFITLPQVYTESADQPGIKGSNLGMYRIQISGGEYERDREVGVHYQIHRGIGVHHEGAIRNDIPFRVNIFVGGAPAMMLAAVMPLPEGMSELGFAGVLSGKRIGMIQRPGSLPIYSQADFCISGTVHPDKQLPEGPFGDHLGYYSKAHDFPVLQVEQVYHRKDPIWPFTVVGRPPQEDTAFGQLIHELTGPVIPTVIPGVRAVHAVDATGVHPLLLAVGSERYVPYEKEVRPQELLTQANAILGQGQLSLAKYLFIVDELDDPQLDIQDIPAFLAHLLQRVDWQQDLHFQTKTTIDTLDYSGSGLNQGSKLVIAARGPARRSLAIEVPAGLRLPDGYDEPRICLPGILAVRGPAWQPSAEGQTAVDDFCTSLAANDSLDPIPLVVIVDDSQFTARSLDNFLWTTFTRSNPASDLDGVGAAIVEKHWGCNGPLVIDARSKSHHAAPLVEDPEVSARVDAMAARGGPLAKHL